VSVVPRRPGPNHSEPQKWRVIGSALSSWRRTARLVSIILAFSLPPDVLACLILRR
jgi:hypothetical protein